MAGTLVEIELESLMVKSNGDVPEGKKPLKKKAGSENNLFIATLVYPRSGAPSVVTTKAMNLRNGKEYRPKGYWKRLIFKEEIQVGTVLRIDVLDRDELSAFAKAVAKIFAGITSSVFGGLVSGPVLGTVATFVLDKVAGAYDAGDGVSLDSIGEFELELAADSLPDIIQGQLVAPKTIKKRYLTFKEGTTEVVRKTTTILAKNAKNGQFRLRVTAGPL